MTSIVHVHCTSALQWDTKLLMRASLAPMKSNCYVPRNLEIQAADESFRWQHWGTDGMCMWRLQSFPILFRWACKCSSECHSLGRTTSTQLCLPCMFTLKDPFRVTHYLKSWAPAFYIVRQMDCCSEELR